jgi:hypothetical protein
MNFFKKFIATMRLNEAIRQADNAAKNTGNRHYVMPTSGTSGKLIIMDRYNFRKLKQKKYINPKATVKDLEIRCFYATPYRNGKGTIPPETLKQKRQNYYNWLMSNKP